MILGLSRTSRKEDRQIEEGPSQSESADNPPTILAADDVSASGAQNQNHQIPAEAAVNKSPRTGRKISLLIIKAK